MRLQLLNSKGNAITQVTVTGGSSLHLGSASLAPGRYKLSVKLTSGTSIAYTLSYSHC